MPRSKHKKKHRKREDEEEVALEDVMDGYFSPGSDAEEEDPEPLAPSEEEEELTGMARYTERSLDEWTPWQRVLFSALIGGFVFVLLISITLPIVIVTGHRRQAGE